MFTARVKGERTRGEAEYPLQVENTIAYITKACLQDFSRTFSVRKVGILFTASTKREWGGAESVRAKYKISQSITDMHW